MSDRLAEIRRQASLPYIGEGGLFMAKDVEFLLAELDVVQARLVACERVRDERGIRMDEIQARAEEAEDRLAACEQERKELLAEVHEKNAILHERYYRLAKAEEALQFYAKQYGLGAALASDGGRIARAALAGIAEPKPYMDTDLTAEQQLADNAEVEADIAETPE